MHGQSSERPGMEDNAEAEQNSLAQAEERTRCAGLLCRWPQRSTSSQILTPLSRRRPSVGAVAGLRCRWELISKSSEIRAEFRKTKSLYPH